MRRMREDANKEGLQGSGQETGRGKDRRKEWGRGRGKALQGKRRRREGGRREGKERKGEDAGRKDPRETSGKRGGKKDEKGAGSRDVGGLCDRKGEDMAVATKE